MIANRRAAIAIVKKENDEVAFEPVFGLPAIEDDFEASEPPWLRRKFPHPSIFNFPSLRAASTSRVNSGGSDSRRLVSISETMPIGMLMKNTHRQLNGP